MKFKEIKKELVMLEEQNYRYSKDRVFDFLKLFKKTNIICWKSDVLGEVKVKKNGNIFNYGTQVFSVYDEHVITEVYYSYRKSALLEMLDEFKEEFDYLKGEQLSLF